MRGQGKEKNRVSFQEQRKKVNILGVMGERIKGGIKMRSVLMKGERGKKGRKKGERGKKKREKETRKEGKREERSKEWGK